VNFRPTRQQRPDINLTPLIDVVFLLLIFFMVSTTFRQETQIRVELPQASAEPAEALERKVLDITLDRDGWFYVDQEQVADRKPTTLKRALARAMGDNTGLPVVIRADANTPHQAVITAMDAASQLGLVRITFATRRPSVTP
jgi:biopolymer transport protein ExbD